MLTVLQNMKTTIGHIALGVAGLTSSVAGLIQMEVRYTDNMIDGMPYTLPSKSPKTLDAFDLRLHQSPKYPN